MNDDDNEFIRITDNQCGVGADYCVETWRQV